LERDGGRGKNGRKESMTRIAVPNSSWSRTKKGKKRSREKRKGKKGESERGGGLSIC